jgi:hypothetical protein
MPGEFKLVFGATAANDKEVAVLTRSIFHLIQTLASQIEVPAEDLAKTRAVPGWESVSEERGATRLVNIRSSKSKPDQAFVPSIIAVIRFGLTIATSKVNACSPL